MSGRHRELMRSGVGEFEDTSVLEFLESKQDDMFFCRRYSCRLTVEDCVKRQDVKEVNVQMPAFHETIKFTRCQDCPQGRVNKIKKLKGEKMEKTDAGAGLAPALENKKPHLATRTCRTPGCEVKLGHKNESGLCKTCIMREWRKNKKCKVPGCEGVYRARGFCGKHWMQWRTGKIDENGKKVSGLQLPAAGRNEKPDAGAGLASTLESVSSIWGLLEGKKLVITIELQQQA